MILSISISGFDHPNMIELRWIIKELAVWMARLLGVMVVNKEILQI